MFTFPFSKLGHQCNSRKGHLLVTSEYINCTLILTYTYFGLLLYHFLDCLTILGSVFWQQTAVELIVGIHAFPVIL